MCTKMVVKHQSSIIDHHILIRFSCSAMAAPSSQSTMTPSKDHYPNESAASSLTSHRSREKPKADTSSYDEDSEEEDEEDSSYSSSSSDEDETDSETMTSTGVYLSGIVESCVYSM